jgi:hypothetical protein
MKAVMYKYAAIKNGLFLNSEMDGTTDDLIKTRLWLNKDQVPDVNGYQAVRIRITAEVVPEPTEGYGDTVKGDDYPKHFDLV